MKLWQKDISPDQKIEAFTIGRDAELDLFLAPFDVLGSIAHVTMLAEIGLLTADEKTLLVRGLQDIYQEILAGQFRIEEGVEDVHSQVEQLLTQRLGEVGKKIHSGRSRNDQVLVDLKLYIRQAIQDLTEGIQTLFDTLTELSEQHKSTLLPGYTHFQVAMPSSFGLWFGAYAESLSDDLWLLHAAYRMADQNPLGSAAGYGSSFPLNRIRTTELLGFQTLSYNVVNAQMGRGKTERALGAALASLAGTVGKMAMDATLFMCQNFGFISFPDELTTGSSIMPHKKNPDVWELIRARCNQVQAAAGEMILVTNNLPSGYHRDFQVLKEPLFDALARMRQCLDLSVHMLRHVRIRTDILDDPRYRFLFSVEAVNDLVLQGVPFREAYRQVGAQIADGSYRDKKDVHHTHEGSIGQLCLPEIKGKFGQVLQQFGFDRAQQALQRLVAD